MGSATYGNGVSNLWPKLPDDLMGEDWSYLPALRAHCGYSVSKKNPERSRDYILQWCVLFFVDLRWSKVFSITERQWWQSNGPVGWWCLETSPGPWIFLAKSRIKGSRAPRVSEWKQGKGERGELYTGICGPIQEWSCWTYRSPCSTTC